ncbi:MAG: hypothetical protein EOO01_07675 [Chitinophagaceae bacterium]|nr:MAG: hypothetical protein EOO01_07675 [Chitinophagaceae bacterium]
MRSYILFLALAALTFSSCTTAYKTGQTPDDVYYSPVRPQDEYVAVQQQDDRYYDGGPDYYTDRYLRMRLNNRYQWSALDDYYFTNPYAYNYYGGYSNWNNPWNSYWAWNSYCNPYYSSPIFIKNPIRYQQIPSRAVVFNPKSYLNTSLPSPQANANYRKGNGGNGGAGSYYTPGSNGGGSSRYNNSNSRNYSNSSNNNNSSNNSSRNNNTPSNSTPTRSYTPSSSNSSSSGRSGSSSSTAPSRPPR